MNGRAARSTSLVAIRRHCRLVAEDIVGVADRVGRTAFVGLLSAEVVFVDRCIAERISDGGKIAELVVGVSGSIAKGVDGSKALATIVVFGVRCVAATIGVGDLATKRVVGDCVGDGRNRDRLNLNPVARNCQRSICRIWDNLGRCDHRDGNVQLVFRDIAADIRRARARRKRGGEAGKLARRRRDERGNGGIGAGDGVGLGEPDGGAIKTKRRFSRCAAPLNGRAARSTRFRDSVAECVVGIVGCWLVVGSSGDESAERVVGVGGCEHGALEAGALFADGLAEEVFVAFREARGRSCFTFNGLRPARAVGKDAVGVELRRDGSAGDGKRVTRGGTSGDACRGVEVDDGDDPPI